MLKINVTTENYITSITLLYMETFSLYNILNCFIFPSVYPREARNLSKHYFHILLNPTRELPFPEIEINKYVFDVVVCLKIQIFECHQFGYTYISHTSYLDLFTIR